MCVHFWYTFGTLFPKSVPKVHMYCTLLVQLCENAENVKSVPQVYQKCTYVVHFWYSFSHFQQKCTKTVQCMYTFGTLSEKSAPKVYQKCTPCVHFWYILGKKCTKSVPKVYTPQRRRGASLSFCRPLLVSLQPSGYNCERP